ncbi:hypothetical protein A3Q56_07351, partial [Intoshia linei]
MSGFKAKMAIIKKVFKGIKKYIIVEEFGVVPSGISYIIKNKEAIMSRVSSLTPTTLKSTKIRAVKQDKVEKSVLTFFNLARSQNIPVSGAILRQKALTYAKKLNITDFNASHGWLTKFRRRNNISFKKICGEKKSVNTEFFQDYSAKNVFNADEFALYYECLPDKTMEYKKHQCFGSKSSGNNINAINLFDAVMLISRAWQRVKTVTIKNCFSKAGMFCLKYTNLNQETLSQFVNAKTNPLNSVFLGGISFDFEALVNMRYKYASKFEMKYNKLADICLCLYSKKREYILKAIEIKNIFIDNQYAVTTMECISR